MNTEQTEILEPTLDLDGMSNRRKVGGKVSWAIAFVALGIFTWSQMKTSWSEWSFMFKLFTVMVFMMAATLACVSYAKDWTCWVLILGFLLLVVLVFTPLGMERALSGTERDFYFGLFAVVSLLIAAVLPSNTHTYLDFVERQIVTVKHYLWFETSQRRRPLTDFSHIVVRHLCIPGGEGPDTYTGSVGLKPVDGKAVLWVKNFPATEDEFPQETQEFAQSLAIWTGLPGAPGGI